MTYIQFKKGYYIWSVRGDYEYHRYHSREEAGYVYEKYMKGDWFMVDDMTFARKYQPLPRVHGHSGFAQ